MNEREKRFRQPLEPPMKLRENVTVDDKPKALPDPPKALPTRPVWEYSSAILARNADISQWGIDGWECYSVAQLPGDMAMFYFRRNK